MDRQEVDGVAVVTRGIFLGHIDLIAASCEPIEQDEPGRTKRRETINPTRSGDSQHVVALLFKWQSAKANLVAGVPLPVLLGLLRQLCMATARQQLPKSVTGHGSGVPSFNILAFREIGAAGALEGLAQLFHSLPHVSSAARFSSM